MPEYGKHYLYPGALFANKQPYYITTILGSCVAVCIYDTRQQFGGMNHFLLPLWNGEGLPSPKFGNIAIRQLISKMKYMGSRKEDMMAKIFGGAAVLNTKREVFFIGERNIKIAKEALEESGIRVIAQSTGGKSGRKIIFNTFNGEVRQKYIMNSSNNQTLPS